MRVELGIEFPACVMRVGSHDPVSGGSIFVKASQANPSGSVFLRPCRVSRIEVSCAAINLSSPPAIAMTETDFGAEKVMS